MSQTQSERAPASAPSHAPSTRPIGLAAAEVLLAGLTLAAVVAVDRLFLDNSWIRPLITTVALAHLTMIAIRRLGRGVVIAALAGAAVMAVQITLTFYRSTATAFLPTAATRDALDADLTAAWSLFGEVKAPTETVVGFVVLAMLGIWLVAFLADWAAFRLASSLEALLPSFAVVVFVAFFGAPERRLAFAGLYLGALLAFLLGHRLWRESRTTRWLADSATAGTAALARAGTALVILAAVGGLVVGPWLPGATEEAIIDLDNRGNGPGSRVVVSPIVDIRGRLVDQPDVEVFTVRSPVASYWRLASLDEFDGRVWGANTSYASVSGALPDDFPSDASVTPVLQQFDITNLGAVWIPAAFEPRAVTDASDDSISYEPVSGTLIVGRDLANSDGLTYTVTSALPAFDPASLAEAPNAYPPEILDRYLQLPDDFSATATEQARMLTEGLTSDYDRALALQDWFQQNFLYDLDVGEGHSSARIDEFLDSRRGYCEQFAGSFAAMARSIGMPARVAVGFTWGDPDPNEPGLWRVRGEHAHAWPEVYIPSAGWVAFEPTPGRGAPGAEGWTGLDPAQEGTGPGSDPVPVPTTQAAPAAPAVPRPGPSDPIPTNIGPGSADADSGLPTPVRWGLGIAGAMMVTIVAYLAAMAALAGVRRHRRRARATDNRSRVRLAWAESVDALRPLGLAPGLSETTSEFTQRVGRAAGKAEDDLTTLGALSVSATYAPSDPGDDAVSVADAARDRIVQAVEARTSLADRLRVLADPRPLLRRG